MNAPIANAPANFDKIDSNDRHRWSVLLAVMIRQHLDPQGLRDLIAEGRERFAKNPVVRNTVDKQKLFPDDVDRIFKMLEFALTNRLSAAQLLAAASPTAHA